MQFVALALRQHLFCGGVCQAATAFAHLAHAALVAHGERKGSTHRLDVDVRAAVEDAQRSVMLLEPLFREDGSEPVARFCVIHERFPFLRNLLRIAPCLGHRVQSTLFAPSITADEIVPVTFAQSKGAVATAVERPHSAGPEEGMHLGCSEQLPGDRYVDRWPPTQRLTASGALLAYQLLHVVGSLFDAFQVRWWAAHATLLGALRNGGLLHQECDVDLALWRPDSHWLVRPAFKQALAAKSVTIVFLPRYFVFRFCALHEAMEADTRSLDGRLSCRYPYVDAHLTDTVQG